MVKFQISEEDTNYYHDWTVGHWALYVPVVKVYYFRETEEEIDALMNELREANEAVRVEL